MQSTTYQKSNKMKKPTLQIFISKAKWQKIKWLVRELALSNQHLFPAFLRDDPTSQITSQSDAASAQSPYSEHSQVQPEPELFEWKYESSLVMPIDVLAPVGTQYTQDVLQEDGSLCTKYDYKVAIYSNARFYSNGTTHVSAFDSSLQRINEFSTEKFNFSVPSICRLKVSQHLSGTTLSLYGNVENAAGNIGHWMVDGISKLFLALEKVDLEEIDHFLVPTFKYDFQRESLIALGIDPQKIVEVDALYCVVCEKLILTSAPRGLSSSVTPGWMIDGYRRQLIPSLKPSTTRRRIYISRRDAGSRKFVDEEEIITSLEEYGFEAVEMSKYDFMGKIELFANAEIVIGLTGSGMTNLMFCSSDTKVIELFPENFIIYVNASMCGHLDLDYRCLLFKNQSILSKINKHYGDLHLESSELLETVREIL